VDDDRSVRESRRLVGLGDIAAAARALAAIHSYSAIDSYVDTLLPPLDPRTAIGQDSTLEPAASDSEREREQDVFA